MTTHELERLFAGRDRPRGALLGDEVEEAADLRAWRNAQLVAADERLRRIGRARPLEGGRELERVQEGQRVDGPRLGDPAEAVERARRLVGRPLRAQERRGVAPQLVRDRQAPDPVAEDGDEAVARRVNAVVQPLERAAEPREQAELVEAAEACAREPLELTEKSFSGRRADPVSMRAEELVRRRVEPQAELVLQAHGAEEPERIVGEDRLRDGPQRASLEIGAARERIDGLAAGEGYRDRVDREVSRREVVLDRPSERREVDGAGPVQRDPPRPVPLRERERRATGAPGEAPCRPLRLGDRDVEVDERPSEQLVANRSADDPRRLVPERLPHLVKHRRPSAARGWGPTRSRTRARR